MKRPYPEQTDWVWIATDKEGQVAAFVTAGEAPIPVKALSTDLEVNPEEAISRLPVISKAELLVSTPEPSSFLEMAERGFFVYDWQDIHRTKFKALEAYDLMAVPKTPAELDKLPASLREAADAIKFKDFAFRETKRIDVTPHHKCEKPARKSARKG